MVKSATILSVTLLILTPAVAYANIENNIKVHTNTSDGGGNAVSSVKVKNEIGQNSSSSVESSTNVDIEHTGDGNSKSEVTINGHTYILEGPGSIIIDNGEENGTSVKNSKTPTPTKVKTEKILGDTALIGNSEERGDFDKDSTSFADAISAFFQTLLISILGF